MATVYEKILELCQHKGVTPGKMCNDLGYSRNTMTALKNGRSTTIKLDKAQRIADYFGVSVDYLLSGERKEKPAAESDGPKSKNKISVLLRRAEKLPKEDYDRITKNFEDTIDLYLKARGLDDD